MNVNTVLNFNTADFLESVVGVNIVCVYGGKGFGLKWFSNKIGKIPLSNQPELNSEDIIKSVFNTIILQDIAVENGSLLGINNSFSFRQRKKGVISDLLYDAYLKHLVNSVPNTDTVCVQKYYTKNMHEKYMAPDSVLIREISG